MLRKNLARIVFLLAVTVLSTGCATRSPQDPDRAPVAHQIAAFSNSAVGDAPTSWEPMIILKTKKPTQYRIVVEQGKAILHAYAHEASSGLMQHVSIDPHSQSRLDWSWKVGNSVETFDVYHQTTEDSPARVILGFDGDKDTLPFTDQILFETAKVLTGHDFPYATLMYIWDKEKPVGTIMSSRRSSRIKMLVVANETDGVGQWRTFSRNIAADYEAAFGEKPNRLIGVGVLTDTDNLGQTVEAWYGDLRLRTE
jgi:hypothetical protein